MKLDDILHFYNLIKDISTKEISNAEDKYKLLKIFRTLKNYNEEFDKFKEDAQSKVISNREEFNEMFSKKDNDEKAKEYVNNLNSELTSLIVQELISEKEINFDKISKDSFIQLSNNNDFTLEQLDCIEQNIVET